MKVTSLKPSAIPLLLHKLLPSGAMTISCFGVGIICMLGHLIYRSLGYGTLAPHLQNGYYGLYYTNYVVGPLTKLFSSSVYVNGSLFVLWGITGLLTYELATHCIQFVRDWRQAKRETSFSVSQASVTRTLRRSLLKQTAWHLVTGITGLYVLLAFRPLIRRATAADIPLVTDGVRLRHDIVSLLGATLVWTAFWYCMLVCVKLYRLRAAISGN